MSKKQVVAECTVRAVEVHNFRYLNHSCTPTWMTDGAAEAESRKIIMENKRKIRPKIRKPD